MKEFSILHECKNIGMCSAFAKKDESSSDCLSKPSINIPKFFKHSEVDDSFAQINGLYS